MLRLLDLTNSAIGCLATIPLAGLLTLIALRPVVADLEGVGRMEQLR